MIDFPAPTETERVEMAVRDCSVELRRTQRILSQVLAEPAVQLTLTEEIWADIEQATEDFRVGFRRLLSRIDAHPRHNEQLPYARRLVTIIKIAAALASELEAEHILHPNSVLAQRARMLPPTSAPAPGIVSETLAGDNDEPDPQF